MKNEPSIENNGVPPRTCGRCGDVLTDEELEKSTESRYMGHHYCSDHLQPALDGEYTLVIK